MTDDRTPPQAADYRYVLPITTRWSDNDAYGHINNVVYYSYFDSVANDFLIRVGGLDITHGDVIGLVVESRCFYHAPAAYPERLRAGMRVDRLGNSSVTYGFAVFREDADTALAHGYYTHVFVDHETRRPSPIPEHLRTALQGLATPGHG